MRSRRKKAAALALGACLLIGSAQAVKASDFTDLKSNHWAYSYIDKAAGAGLVSGMGNGKFGPEEKLSNAQFITMVCNLLYEDNVKSFPSGSGSSWWLPYLNAAQSVGILDNTTIAAERAAASAWSAKMANAEINRYDMAQIMMNVAKQEGWSSATSAQISAAKSQIADWSSIPSKYQDAVASAYAKKYLSGMDSQGTFLGTATMNRAQGAVVLCKLSDENETAQNPVYTNTTNLVNGKIPNAANVASALNALRMEYPQNYSWNMNKAYESEQMGTSIGSEAFANTLSDRVFGNLKAQKHTNAAALKVGDVVYMSKTGLYGVVTDVDDEMFDYVGCSETGSVTWRGTAWLSDLGSRDTITTRYGSTTVENALANGQSPTENNVYRALWNLNSSYYDGSVWSANERYTSKVLGTGYGSRALAYFFSDEVFGDLKSVQHYRPNDLRVGDVFCMGNQNDDNAYGIVVEVNKTQGTFQYANVYNNTVEWDNSARLTDLNGYPIFSRYPNTTASTNPNSSTITESSVLSQISSLQQRFPATFDWSSVLSTSYRYTSNAALLGTGYNSQALAYYLSDQIFGTLSASRQNVTGSLSNLRVGDVVVFNSGYNNAGLVTSVNRSNNTFTYTLLSGNTASWYWSGSLNDLTNAVVYTRYPTSTTSTGSYNNAATGTLANGAQATDANAAAIISNLRNVTYPANYYWGTSTAYTSASSTVGTGTGNQGFVYKLSDEIFGNLPATAHSNYNSIRVGDIIRYNNGLTTSYGLVNSVSNGLNGVNTVYYTALNNQGNANWNNSLSSLDLYNGNVAVYTRYPSSSTGSTTVFNTTTVTNALNQQHYTSGYTEGAVWNTSDSYTSKASAMGTAAGAQTFAYRVSDNIFGSAAATAYTFNSNTPSTLKVGDVFRTNDGKCGIVTNINILNNTFSYAWAYNYSLTSLSSSQNTVTWNGSGALSDLNGCTIYTRY